jgi:phosphatidate cytidylyltransferase
MAFNWQTFRARTLTAAVFVVVMLAGLLLNSWSFFILFSIIHFGCWVEYQKLVGQIDKNYREITPFHKYGVMIAGWCIMLYFSSGSFHIGSIRLQEIGWWLGIIFIFVLPVVELLFEDHIHLKNIAHSAFGLVYISLSLGLMVDLFGRREIHFHDEVHLVPSYFFPVVIIAAIWINDTMAYIVGSLIGRRPLSSISPKKTWEGTIGGIILSVAVCGLVAVYVLHVGQLSILICLIAAVAAVAGAFGDLMESKLKRLANVKDSGSIMPGHGGFLDRFDSLLVAVPFVWLLLAMVGVIK